MYVLTPSPTELWHCAPCVQTILPLFSLIHHRFCFQLADDPTPACRVSLAENDPFKILSEPLYQSPLWRILPLSNLSIILVDETTRLENCIVQQKRRLTVEEHQKLSPRYDSILSELKRRLDWATTQDARSRIEDEISNMRARSLLFLCQPIAPIADPDRYRPYLEEAHSKYKDTYGLVIGGLSKCHPLHLKAVKVFAAFTMSTLNQKGEARSILAAALHAIGITAPGYDLSSISEEAKLLIQEIFQAWNAPNC